MYPFLSRISKLSARKGSSRFLSSLSISLNSTDDVVYRCKYRYSPQHQSGSDEDISPSLPQSPYLWDGTEIRAILSQDVSPPLPYPSQARIFQDPESVRNSYYDPKKGKTCFTAEKDCPYLFSCSQPVGASHGWVLKVSWFEVFITDFFKPWVSSPQIIYLPPLYYGHFLSNKAKAVSLSSYDPVQDISDNKIKYSRSLHLVNNPRISVKERKELVECILTHHLVESPSGELIFIKWYTECIEEEYTVGKVEVYPMKPKRFMVFREDEKSGKFCYTEDIGDLCIYYADSQGQENCMYYQNGPMIGRYCLDSAKVSPFVVQGLVFDLFHGTHWISPS